MIKVRGKKFRRNGDVYFREVVVGEYFDYIEIKSVSFVLLIL